MISYQKEMYDLLPTEFSRKQLLQLASDCNINGATAVSYIHCWMKRSLISKTNRGLYMKNSEQFIPGNRKELEALHAVLDIPKPEDTPIQQSSASTDAVLDCFSIKSATDEELLQELVARGYKWAMMFKTTIVEVKYSDYKPV